MDHLVITVHGIRTFGHWQRRLEDLLIKQKGTPKIQVDSIDYGYFSVLAFCLPPVRWLATRRIRKLLLKSITARPWRRIDIVAHSFGTHLVGWALQGLTIEQREKFRIHTIIFAGSVLHPRFPWDPLLDDETGCVDRVVNDCGTGDVTLLFSQAVVPLASMAGRIGFRGVINERFRNRYFAIGHSGYFITGKKPNEFIEQWWVPLLTTEEPIKTHDARSPSALTGFYTFVINNAEPAKFLGYFLLIYLLIYTPIHNLLVERQQARRTDLVTRLADAAWNSRTEDEDTAQALLVARQAYLYNELFRTRKTALVDRALRKLLSTPYASVTLLNSEGDLTAADFSPDGRWLVIAGDDRTLWLWELEKRTATPIALAYDGGVIRAVRFRRPDSKGLVAVTDTAAALFWDILDNSHPPRRRQLTPGGEMQTVAISHDSQWFAAGLPDGRIRIWHLDEPDQLPTDLCCHARAVSVLAFHPLLHQILASGSVDQTVRLWDRSHPESHLLEFNEPKTPVTALAWNPDGRRLAVGTKGSLPEGDAAVLIGDTFARPRRLRLLGRHKAMVSSLDFSRDGHTLASAGSGDRTIQLWHLDSPDEAPTRLRKHQGVLIAALFDPPGRYLVSIDIGDRGIHPSTARLWYLGDPPAAPHVLEYHKGPVTAMTFAPHDSLLASVGGIDAALVLYDVQKRRVLGLFDHGEANVESVQFSPDGKVVATGSKSSLMADEADFRVRLWDVNARASTPRRILDGHGSAVKGLALSSDGRWLASSGYLDRQIRLWNLTAPQGKPAIISTGVNQVLSMVFRPGTPVLAWAGSDKSVYLKNIEVDATPVHVLRGHAEAITALVFTPDGKRIISGGVDKKIYIWNPDQSEAQPVALAQPSAVMALAIDKSGRTLASGGDDGWVWMWDLESPAAEPRKLDGPGRNILSVSFSADGRYLAAGGANGKITIWPTTAFLAEQACLIARHNMTASEWSTVIGSEYECTCSNLPPCQQDS